MPSSADWFAKKLGTQPSQPHGLVVQPREPAPITPPQPVVQQPVPQQPVQQAPPPPPQEAVDPNAEVHMGDAIKQWKGGEAHRKEGHLSCPACGNATSYTAFSGRGSVNGASPRARCFECGYNGSYMQGDEANWA